ncbi:hypothetical protein GCM10023081_20660 [Arthrobacter ginkgonis]|uniref:Uncharacterized protein n=1 Tax=Arthrobacter ginkgonis TaxID=1630594 RepID=A0ABP7C7L1_9MICC
MVPVNHLTLSTAPPPVKTTYDRSLIRMDIPHPRAGPWAAFVHAARGAAGTGLDGTGFE